MLGNAVSCSVFQPHSWSHKNGTWAWNTSLPRDREPTQPVPSSLPCVGISFPVATQVCSFVLLKHMCQWSSDIPLAFNISNSTSWSSFYIVQEVCILTSFPVLAVGRGGTRDPLAMGNQHRLELTLLCLFCM